MRKAAGKIITTALTSFMLLSTVHGALAKQPTAASNGAFDAGVSLYKQKNYRGAAQQFEAAMQAEPNNPDIIYYCALCAQLSNNRARAKQLFEYLTSRFPQSRVAPNAKSALDQLSSISASTGNASSSSGGESTASSTSTSGTRSQSIGGSGSRSLVDLTSVPDVVKVPFERNGNDIIVQAEVNGKAVSFVLDTGAGGVVVGQNHLHEWGIASSQPKETAEVRGVGDGKAKSWFQHLDLKLGPIYQKNFPVSVMDNMPTEPLLGQSFLRSFNVNIDDTNRMVVLAKKGSTGASDMARKNYNSIEVPFKRSGGGHMQVSVQINGKPCLMLFDTGCQTTSFSMSDWKKLGLEIPSNARKGISRGVLGDTTAYYFNAESIKLLGKPRFIEQSNSTIMVNDGSPASLLGMSFYGQMNYKIDTVHSVILFDNPNQ